MNLEFPQHSQRLGDLIRGIRSCKTAADERAYISKESGLLRTAFRDQDVENRTRNVAKLLYLHMLGYPSQYGQLECLKLVASNKYGDKRIGYLGAQILLDERCDTHLLLTNCIINDLQSSNQFACSLALCTLGNLCSTEMARDLHEVLADLLLHRNPLIRKKSALCAARIVRKVPELAEIYVPATRKMLQEKLHSDLLSGITLAIQLCKANKMALEYFRSHIVTDMSNLLTKLVDSGLSTDFDVMGINDPFLQVKLVQLLGLLGENDQSSSETMQDAFALAATNTDSTKNVGNAVLIEVVRSILKIKAEPSLRVMAINILGKLLMHDEGSNGNFYEPSSNMAHNSHSSTIPPAASLNCPTKSNYRCVTLQILQDCALSEPKAVQKHRNTVLDCLRDPDLTIRKRAYELSFYLINKTNIEPMMKEILKYLKNTDGEMKSFICSEVIVACQRYAPSLQWHFESILELVILAAGHLSSSDVISIINQLILVFAKVTAKQSGSLSAVPANFAELMLLSFHAKLESHIDNQPLVQIASWFLGDYVDLLPGGFTLKLTALFRSILTAGITTEKSKRFILTSLVKIAYHIETKCGGSGLPLIIAAIEPYSSALDLEIQQRALEYAKIISNPVFLNRISLKNTEIPPSIADEYLVDCNQVYHLASSPSKSGDSDGSNLSTPTVKNTLFNHSHEQQTQYASPSLHRASVDGAGAVAKQDQHTDLLSGTSNLLNLLGDLSGPPPKTPTQQNLSGHPSNDLLDLDPSIATSPLAARSKVIYRGNGISLSYTFKNLAAQPNTLMVQFSTVTTGPDACSNYQLLVAVPKTYKLQLLPATDVAIAANGAAPVGQQAKITIPDSVKAIKMRLKINFTINGADYGEQVDLSISN